jgi:predicted GNAT family N-acyltransferase
MTSAVRVVRASADEDIRRAFAIRMRVFVKEQKVPAEIELDEDDAHAMHLLALVGEKAVGTARIVFHGGRAKIGRMAVVKTYRKNGVGRRLLRRAVAIARRRTPRTIYLNAQVAVIGFYEKMGFQCRGPIFDEAGIPHRKMILKRGNRQ